MDEIVPGSPEWLAARRSGIGGSEISALYRRPDGTCAHPWISETELWAMKTGRIPDHDPTPQEAPHLYVGRVLEQPVREMYETFSGRTVGPGSTLVRDAESPVLLANTDGTQTCPRRSEPGVYEGKVTTVFRRRDWFQRIEEADGSYTDVETTPLHYKCQTQHYMACDDKSWASVVCFMQGDKRPIHWRDIERHDAFISDMRERAARWWRDHVVADVAPAIDGSAATEDALRKIHRDAEDIALQLPAAFAGVLDRLDAIAEFSKLLTSERQRLRNLVLSTMGRAALAVIADDGRGWSLRGRSGRALRALTLPGVQRAGRSIRESMPVYVPAELGARIDELYRINLRALEHETLGAKAMHMAHLAALAAKSVSLA